MESSAWRAERYKNMCRMIGPGKPYARTRQCRDLSDGVRAARFVTNLHSRIHVHVAIESRHVVGK